LLLSPVSRDAIFLGKAAASFLFMLLVEVALLPVFAVLLNFSALSFTLIFTIVLATLGFALVGTLFSAIAVQTRSREIMLPVLFFPVVLPVLIGAVEASTLAIGGESIVGLERWLPLIGVFDALFLVICPWAFSIVSEE
jgi:heme exporter protein B